MLSLSSSFSSRCEADSFKGSVELLAEPDAVLIDRGLDFGRSAKGSHDEPNHGHRRLLGVRRERQHCRAPERCDELPPPQVLALPWQLVETGQNISFQPSSHRVLHCKMRAGARSATGQQRRAPPLVANHHTCAKNGPGQVQHGNCAVEAYSATSSAMASSSGGNAMPSALAVLRLMTNSNVLD
jgi:hypothetical protein